MLLSAGVILAAPALARPAVADRARDLAPTPLVVTRVVTARPLLALTFDDGPHATLTPQLLDILAARGVRATFYVIGNRIAAHREVLARIAADGHEIGNHSWSHPSLSGLSDAAILAQVDRTAMAVQEVVGRPPVTLRPPYGNLTQRQSLMLRAERNLPTVLWSVDPEDWRRPGAPEVASRIIARSHPGAVILSHDIIGGTVAAMPAALDGLLARGYQFVTLSELIGWPRWNTRRIRIAAQS
jgi:peptidoglycan/xylan/chitin deacetylase (PgdA/CDA1 family)